MQYVTSNVSNYHCITTGIKISCKRKKFLYIRNKTTNSSKIKVCYIQYCNVLWEVIEKLKKCATMNCYLHLQINLKCLRTLLIMKLVARHDPHRTHDLRNSSQDLHPSTNLVQKTVCCNSTSNAPDDGCMRPKHVKLRIHQ